MNVVAGRGSEFAANRETLIARTKQISADPEHPLMGTSGRKRC